MNIRLIAAGMLIAGSLAMENVAAQGTAAPLEFNYGYTTADHVNLYVAGALGERGTAQREWHLQSPPTTFCA